MGIWFCKDAAATVDSNYHHNVEYYERRVGDLQAHVRRLEAENRSYKFGMDRLVKLYNDCENCRNK